MKRRSKPSRTALAGVSLVLLALLLSACADNAPQDYLNHPVGANATEADRLWDMVFAVAVVIFVLVEALLVYALFRFRERPDRHAAQFHGNTKVEVVLTVIPALILAAVAIPTLRTIFDQAAEASGSYEIKVIGHQFWWEYQYEDAGIVTANELHIPVGTPVRLTIEGAANDVIHSFWVPRISGKQDVVPGRRNFLTLEVDRPGVYLGQCTEYCGLSHANMRLRVYAQEQDDFDEWVEDQQREAQSPGSGEAARGERLFVEGACAGCHTVGGTDAQGKVGPDLTHFAGRDTFAGAMFERNDENLRRWLQDPPGVKPGAQMPDLGLPPEDIEALIAYLNSLE